MAHIEIENLSFSYPSVGRPSLTDVSLAIRRGEYVVLCGKSGSGKTTLLRHLKSVLTPHGKRSGDIRINGVSLEDMSQRDQAAKVGFVMQNPDDQIVTDKVWHELAFGLESLGCDQKTMRARVAEMACYFGIQDWFHRDVSNLSGGQKQLLNLASIMAMQPEILILDEPTSQLDPIAASDFLNTLRKINAELGTTILITEHRVEDIFPYADRAVVMDGGRVIANDTPRRIGERLWEEKNDMFTAMPTPVRVFYGSGGTGACPLTVREGRNWLSDAFSTQPEITELPAQPQTEEDGEIALSLKELWFRYEKNSPDILRGASVEVIKGSLHAIVGGNGAGKSTTLKAVCGICRPYRGKVKVLGKPVEKYKSQELFRGCLAMLPQDPKSLFVRKTVLEDLQEMTQNEQDIRETAEICQITSLLKSHPYDLSGGEQQRAALAKVLLHRPDILLLDEPTKGLDAAFKQSFAAILSALTASGVSVLMVSHDVAFCAQYAHRCALFFDGSIVTCGTPRAFFSGNSFYTTSANRMARTLCPEAVTPEDVMTVIGGTVPPQPEQETAYQPLPPAAEESAAWKPKKLPWWRKAAAVLCGGGALAIFWHAARNTDLTRLGGGGALSQEGWRTLGLYGLFIALLFGCIAAVGRRSRPLTMLPTPMQRRRLSRRTRAAALLILLCIPATLYLGFRWLGNTGYYPVAFAVLLECMAPFFLVFEGRRPQARELVLVATLCALGVAGRAAFFMLPQFKPVLALTIISGVALGGETGFLVGAVTMLASNVLFSQGPWTPFQMFAMGIIGFLAGVLFRRGWLRRSRAALCVFGAIAAVVIYGGIMNPMSALLYARTLEWKVIAAYYVTGFPVDCVHAAATVFFLWVLAEPMLEKLDRIKVKYGLVE